MSENNSDQFSLVSLEKGSQKAASSYANMSKRARGEKDSTLSINEEEAQEQKPTPPPKPKPQKTAEKQKKPTQKLSSKSGPPSAEKIDQSIDDMIARFEEFTETVQVLLANGGLVARNLFILMLTPLIPVFNILLKLLDRPLQFINVLTRKINDKMGRKPPAGTTTVVDPETGEVSDVPAEEDLEEMSEEVELELSSFSDMMELNIIFTDNMKKGLYKKNPNNAFKLSAMEEDLIMSNAVLAIQECAEFTLELPSPGEGIYAGQRIYDIMSNANGENIGIFLGFVKAYPGKYIGKEWKISETFATWLINNAPTSE